MQWDLPLKETTQWRMKIRCKSISRRYTLPETNIVLENSSSNHQFLGGYVNFREGISQHSFKSKEFIMGFSTTHTTISASIMIILWSLIQLILDQKSSSATSLTTATYKKTYSLSTFDWLTPTASTHPSGVGELLGSRFQEAQAALIRSDNGQRLPSNGHSGALLW